MEEKIFPRPAVAGILEEMYVEARLHADGEVNVDRIHELQDAMAKSRATPLYLIVDPSTEKELARQEGASSEAKFLEFLEHGAEASRVRVSRRP